MSWFKPKHQEVKLHRPGATVARAGRYLMVDMRVSTKSKRDRQIARDVAEAILAEVGENEATHRYHSQTPVLGANGSE